MRTEQSDIVSNSMAPASIRVLESPEAQAHAIDETNVDVIF